LDDRVISAGIFGDSAACRVRDGGLRRCMRWCKIHRNGSRRPTVKIASRNRHCQYTPEGQLPIKTVVKWPACQPVWAEHPVN